MSSISQQKINSLYIKELKCLKDVDISFEDKAVTAILGPNGHGKSTILHALACCYQPIDENITSNYRFSDFFLPNTDAQWQGSELTLTHIYRNGKRESIVELSELINIRHIVTKPEKTYCFNETKPDAIHRLTGKQEKSIEIFVEDDLASAILNKIASSLKIKKYVSIKKFGAAPNCFTTVAGLLISNENIGNTLFVLDGDVLVTQEEQKKQINKAITGHGDNIESHKNQALQHIKKLNLPEDSNPEKYLHGLLMEIDNSDNEEFNEILEVTKEISYEQDSHKYLSKIIERLDYNKSVGYTKIVDLVSTHCQDQWQSYISEVHTWLKEKVPEVRESN